jgi:hypothetical protein
MMTSQEGRMPTMRRLLEVDPSIPVETREAIARHEAGARNGLVRLGLNECEAAELLDEVPDASLNCG